jgi:hypothetical protein
MINGRRADDSQCAASRTDSGGAMPGSGAALRSSEGIGTGVASFSSCNAASSVT